MNTARHKLSPPVLLLAICLCLCLLRCQPASEPEYRFRVSLLMNEQHTWYKAFVHFKHILEQRSNGRIRVEVYPSEQLAKEIEAIRMIQAGIIEMTVTSSLMSNWIEIAAFCEMPFLLRDTTDMKELINGPLGKRIEREMLEKTGLRPVAYFPRGARHLTSNRPIRHPDELKGLILRVPNVPSFVVAWEAMGAKPTPMAFSEVFTALQQGTVEAQENPFDLILTSSFSEVQKYINLTGHVISWGYAVVGEKQFQQLPHDLQTLFLQAAKEMQAYEHALFLASERSIQDELRRQGMEFIEVDKAAFQEKCGDAIYNSLSPAMQEVYSEYLQSRH
ncbi:MAG: TRAP transporter substrate-binding protein [Bacteroidetes bacterium]|nr:MAG: TRAP transporter substrate-binding protein [Bacteroidota bacterium]